MFKKIQSLLPGYTVTQHGNRFTANGRHKPEPETLDKLRSIPGITNVVNPHAGIISIWT